jgi:hypothetical protein
MQHLSLSTEEAVNVLPCPNCRATINTSMQQCPFCSALIDHSAAITSAEAFAKVNEACSDASYMKGTFGLAFFSLIVLKFLHFRISLRVGGFDNVPFLGLITLLVFTFLLLVVAGMAIRWWIKFGSIVPDDREFAGGRKNVRLIGMAAVALIPVAVICYQVL